MQFRKTILISTIVLALAGQFSTSMAREPVDQGLIDAAMPMVEIVASGFFVTAPNINNLIVMNVRVYNHKDEQVLYVRSLGEPVELLAADLPDGEYRYELNTVFELDEFPAENGPYGNEAMSRNNGQFIIRNTEVVSPGVESMDESASLMDSVLESAVSLVAYSLSPLLSDANAQDGHFNNVWLDGSNPELVFNDHYAFNSTRDFSIKVTANNTETAGRWALYDEIGVASPATAVIIIDTVADSAIEKSFVVGNNGNLSWANMGMWFDRSEQQLAIGTTATPGDFTVRSFAPNIWFQDETDGSESILQLNNGTLRLFARPTTLGDLPYDEIIAIDTDAPSGSLVIEPSGLLTAVGGAAIGRGINTLGTIFAIGNPGSQRAQMEFVEESGSAYIEWGQFANKMQFEGPTGATTVEFDLSAPADSMVLSNSGNLGIGTNSPHADVHVLGADGDAKILVEELNFTAATRTLFQLKNKGNTKFGVRNTEAGVEWAFANPGTGFRLSRQGSGVVEMEIFNNGNVTIAGSLTENSDVNAKTAITDVNPEKILSLVTELPLSQWEYKDARGETHIGPMAQDFYAAFGLGASETGISTIDTAGVALVAIQALANSDKLLREENRLLRHAVERLQSENQALVASQQEQFADLKAMVIDLQMHAQSQSLLTSLR